MLSVRRLARLTLIEGIVRWEAAIKPVSIPHLRQKTQVAKDHRRPHQAMNNQFPMAAWRAGMDRIEAAKTVDMPLRLDNANALPTYSQQTQKQQQEAA
jgi:hypothetical protein